MSEWWAQSAVTTNMIKVMKEATVGRSATVRSAERRRQHLRVIPTAHLDCAWCAAALCEALCDEGIVLLRLPESENAAEKFEACLAALREFFAYDRQTKNFCAASDGPGCQVGYMCAEAGGAEMFEAKVVHDPRWPWPNAKLREAVLQARAVLHKTARTCLIALAAPLGLDADALLRLLDEDSMQDCDTTSAERFARSSNTTMRIWQYWEGGSGNEAHTDNTLLTISPPGDRVGLGVRLLPDGTPYWPEGRMRPDELILFAGDALGYLTQGQVRPLLHWVEPPRAAGSTRMSMPFFLRPRLDALLEPAVGRDGVEMGGHDDHASDTPQLGAIRQRQLEQNAGNMRWRWPWKVSPYYFVRPDGQAGEQAGLSLSSTPSKRL